MCLNDWSRLVPANPSRCEDCSHFEDLEGEALRSCTKPCGALLRVCVFPLVISLELPWLHLTTISCFLMIFCDVATPSFGFGASMH